MSFWEQINSEKTFQPDDLINRLSANDPYVAVIRGLTIEEASEHIKSRVFTDTDTKRMEFVNHTEHFKIVALACVKIENLKIERLNHITSGQELVAAYQDAKRSKDSKMIQVLDSAIGCISNAIVEFAHDSKKNHKPQLSV